MLDCSLSRKAGKWPSDTIFSSWHWRHWWSKQIRDAFTMRASARPLAPAQDIRRNTTKKRLLWHALNARKGKIRHVNFSRESPPADLFKVPWRDTRISCSRKAMDCIINEHGDDRRNITHERTVATLEQRPGLASSAGEKSPRQLHTNSFILVPH
jgi:hypothetical protein